MAVRYIEITDFPRGTLMNMLKDGYSFEPRFERDWIKQWEEFDNFFYNNPHIAKTCGFITILYDTPIGFVTWNPTNLPESVEIGHNCILTEYKGNGYGLQQMKEAVRRITETGARRIVVWTNEICVPAQHTYESAGFRFVKRTEEPFHPEYSGERIHYELAIPKVS